MSKDYYKILGVEKNASQEDVKKAYKRLAKKYHPDVNKEHDAADKFKEINEAAAVLSNPDNRQRYDQFGTADVPHGDFSGFDFRDFAGANFDDIFDNFFSGFGFGGRRSKNASRGRDLATEMEITLKDAATGVTKKLPVDKLTSCSHCNGSGAESGDKSTCDSCNGQGVVRHAKQTAFGVFATTSTCKHCNGSGEIINNPCKKCEGQGRVEEEKIIEIKIPAGIDNGMRLRVAGEGEAGARNASAGDLYVTVYVKDDEQFKRDGNDVYVDVSISFALACLGGGLEVPTLDGSTTLNIPSGTQGGTVFRIKGKGLPDIHGNSQGHEYVKVQIVVPAKLSKKQREVLVEFSDEADKKKGWFF